jgi:hypothetical protein
MRIYLRYSPACGTNWAKAEITSSNPSNYSFQMVVRLVDSNYNYLNGTQYGLVGRTLYGNMYYAPNLPVRACASNDTFGGVLLHAAG